MSHMEFVASESAALNPTGWDRWIDKAEALIGHSLDGNDEDGAGEGYSMDEAVACFHKGVSPAAYVAMVATRDRYTRPRSQDAGVEDHKWFDPVCHAGGCRSLILTAALKRLSFAAQTTGGTAGRDEELVAAIEQARAALTA